MRGNKCFVREVSCVVVKMGNCCEVQGAVDHWIYVKIGDRKPPLTDARLRVIVQDIKGKQSSEIKMDCMYKNQFDRGGQDIFQVGRLEHLETL